MSPLEITIGRLHQKFTDPAKRELLATIAEDAFAVAELSLSDPQKAFDESAHIGAQMANLTAEEAVEARNIILGGIRDAVVSVIRGVLGFGR